jgi:tetratricopeptide (TPR) repeat protein
MKSQTLTMETLEEGQFWGPTEIVSVTSRTAVPIPSHSFLPENLQRDFALGVELVGIGEPVKAAELFEKVLQMTPEFADGHVALGMAYAMTSKIYPALDHLERAVQLESDNFFAHFKLGHLYFKLRIPYKGYKQMDLALECAGSFRERQLVAYLIREERKREHKGFRRPWWNKPFSRKALYAAATLGASAGVVLLRVLHLH